MGKKAFKKFDYPTTHEAWIKLLNAVREMDDDDIMSAIRGEISEDDRLIVDMDDNKGAPIPITYSNLDDLKSRLNVNRKIKHKFVWSWHYNP